MDFGGESYDGSFPKLEIRGRVPKKERIYNCYWRNETAAAAVEKKEGEQVLVDEGSQKSEERETLLVKENVIKGSDHDVEEKAQETAAAETEDHVEGKSTHVKEVEDDDGSQKSKHEFENEHLMIKESDDDDDDEKTAHILKDEEDEEERESRDEESPKQEIENEHMIKKSDDDDDDDEIAGDDDEQEEKDRVSQLLKLLLKLPTNPMIKNSDDEGENNPGEERDTRGFGGHHTCQIFFGTIPALVHIHTDQETQAPLLAADNQPSEFVPESDDHLLQQAAEITAPTNQEDGDERETVGEEDVKREEEEEEEMMSFGGKNYEELFPRIEIKARISKRERRGELSHLH